MGIINTTINVSKSRKSGKKFSLSAGAIYRTHTKAYGYNPIEIWLNETEIIEGE